MNNIECNTAEAKTVESHQIPVNLLQNVVTINREDFINCIKKYHPSDCSLLLDLCSFRNEVTYLINPRDFKKLILEADNDLVFSYQTLLFTHCNQNVYIEHYDFDTLYMFEKYTNYLDKEIIQWVKYSFLEGCNRMFQNAKSHLIKRIHNYEIFGIINEDKVNQLLEQINNPNELETFENKIRKFLFSRKNVIRKIRKNNNSLEVFQLPNLYFIS